jgi:homoserine kinase type II
MVAGRPGWVLRISQNLSAEQVRAESRLLRRLGAAGLPFAVPSPAELTDGTGTVAETAEGPATLYRWIPGIRPGLSSAADMEAAGRAFGRLDAALRSVPARDAPHDWRDESLPDVTGVCAELSAAGLSVDVLAATAARIGPLDLPVQVTHGDLGSGNVLVDPGTGAVTGILDFEIAGASLRIGEVVAALLQTGALSFDERWPPLTAALLRGYRSACALTPAEIEAVPGLLLSRAVGSTLWRTARWRRGQATLREVENRLTKLDELARWLDGNGGALLDVLSAAAFPDDTPQPPPATGK